MHRYERKSKQNRKKDSWRSCFYWWIYWCDPHLCTYRCTGQHRQRVRTDSRSVSGLMVTSSVLASVVRKSQSCACPVASLPAPNEYLSIFRVRRPLIGPSGSVSCVMFSSRFLRALLSLPSLGNWTIQLQRVRSPLRCCQCRLCAQQWTEEDTAEETHPCLREFTGNILCKTFFFFFWIFVSYWL